MLTVNYMTVNIQMVLYFMFVTFFDMYWHSALSMQNLREKVERKHRGLAKTLCKEYATQMQNSLTFFSIDSRNLWIYMQAVRRLLLHLTGWILFCIIQINVFHYLACYLWLFPTILLYFLFPYLHFQFQG